MAISLRLIILFLIMVPQITLGKSRLSARPKEIGVNKNEADSISVWKVKYDSAQLLWRKDINASIRLLQSAEQITFNDLGIYDGNYLAILNDLGIAYGEIKNFKKAEIYLRKSISLQQEIYNANDVRILKSTCNLASLYSKSGEDQKAKSIYKGVLKKSVVAEEPSTYKIAAENLVRLFEVREQYDSAMIILKKACTVEFTNSVPQDLYELRLEEVRILRKRRSFDDAAKALSVLASDLEGQHNQASLSHSIIIETSLINIETGIFVKAESDLLQLYRYLKSSPDTEGSPLAELTSGLGYLYEKLGVYDKALVYYRESLSRCVLTSGYNSLGCMIIQNNIAGIYLKQGSVKEAILEYEGFINTLKSVSTERNITYLTALNNLATAYRQNGQYTLALTHLYEVHKILEEKNQLSNDLAASVMNNMAVTFTMEGDHGKAANYFEKVLKIKEALYGEMSPVLLDVVGNLAVSYWLVKRYADASPLFKRSLKLSIKEVNYIFPSLTATEQVQFYKQQKQNFERFNTISIESASSQPALLVNMFDNQLLLKSLTFFTTKKRNSMLDKGDNAHLKNLSNTLAVKRTQLSQYYQMPLSQLNEIRVSLPTLETEIDSLEKIIRQSVHSAGQQQNLEWFDIQKSLTKDEVLIEMIRFRKYDALTNTSENASKKINIGFTDSVYYAALITTAETKDFPKLVVLKNGNQLEKRYLAFYRNSISFDMGDTISYSHFVKPFESELIGKGKIYFSADGVYHQINLNAIQDPEGKFVLEKFDLHPIMNARQLVERREHAPIDFSKTVLFGNPAFEPLRKNDLNERSIPTKSFIPLPGTLEEVNSIAKLLKVPIASKGIFIGQEASEANFRKVISPSVLHIATHGFFSDRFVYLNENTKEDFLFHSGIILAPSSRKVNTNNSFDTDGIITAFDVMNLELNNTDLVVVSACDTGLGRIEISEGVHGLQQSFLQAGASDIIVSLWKVEDMMTKNLMVKFYSYLSLQRTSREAFRLAQVDMLREVQNPRQWAGFVIVSGN